MPDSTAATQRFQRLPDDVRITTYAGLPTIHFQTWTQEWLEGIEEALNGIDDQIEAIETINEQQDEFDQILAEQIELLILVQDALAVQLDYIEDLQAWQMGAITTLSTVQAQQAAFVNQLADVVDEQTAIIGQLAVAQDDLADAQTDISTVQGQQAAQLVLINNAISDIAAATIAIASVQDEIIDVQVEQGGMLDDIIAAQNAADEAAYNDSLTASYTVPSAVLSAADTGSSVTITIASHVRRYGDGTSVSVNGSSVGSRSYNTTYAIYYNDYARNGGTVSYIATTSIAGAQNNQGAGRHLVGTIRTPAAAAPPTSGGTSPPGSGYLPHDGTSPYNIP